MLVPILYDLKACSTILFSTELFVSFCRFLTAVTPGVAAKPYPRQPIPRMRFAWAYEIRKFVNYLITKYIKFQSFNNQTETHLTSVKLS